MRKLQGIQNAREEMHKEKVLNRSIEREKMLKDMIRKNEEEVEKRTREEENERMKWRQQQSEKVAEILKAQIHERQVQKSNEKRQESPRADTSLYYLQQLQMKKEQQRMYRDILDDQRQQREVEVQKISTSMQSLPVSVLRESMSWRCVDDEETGILLAWACKLQVHTSVLD
jgi:hypothetical protein